jgi:hypothetical protein
MGVTNINLIHPEMFNGFLHLIDPNAFQAEALKKSVINKDNTLVIYKLKEGQAMDYIKRYSDINKT